MEAATRVMCHAHLLTAWRQGGANALAVVEMFKQLHETAPPTSEATEVLTREVEERTWRRRRRKSLQAPAGSEQMRRTGVGEETNAAKCSTMAT